MSLISRTAQYALRAMTLLAAQDGRMTVKQLAQAVGAPQPYLARIIMNLADEGMIDARRGPGGGLKLGRDPFDINLMDIVQCFDGNSLFEECCLGLPGCSDSLEKCPVHETWGQLRQQIATWWRETSLADLSPEMTCKCMAERVQMHPEVFEKNHRQRGRWH
ncbi:MAG: Rrf2 family transcriptional regulator [bacterium]|nr:Rrf2 family transcriptional regulator [bacterium]